MIKDTCQSHLGERRGRKFGTWGDMGQMVEAIRKLQNHAGDLART